MKIFFYELLNGCILIVYWALDKTLDSTLNNSAAMGKLFGAIVFSVYFLNQIRWRIIKPHYDGSWKKWVKDWFGLRSKK